MVGGYVPSYWRRKSHKQSLLKHGEIITPDQLKELSEDIENNSKDEVIIEVLEENEITVTVFQLCQWTVLAGIGAFYQGISALEIESVLRMLNIDQSKWQEVVIGIKSYMVPSAQKQLNKEKK